MNSRECLLELFNAALAAVEPSRLVRENLRDENQAVGIVAIGKAANGMLQGAQQALSSNIQKSLLILPRGYPVHIRADRILHAAHPVPDEASIEAGRVLLNILADENIQRWLFLISGGASALVEVPAPGVTLADIRRANEWLLASGFDIRQMNAIRARLSAIKGGKLLKYLSGKSLRLLLMSDVPGDDPSVIGSGLLVSSEESAKLPELPGWLQALMPSSTVNISAGPGPEVIASNAMALDAVKARAAEFGMDVVHRQDLRGDADVAGREFAQAMVHGAPGIYLAGGEATVSIPGNAGRGGRNQHFALAAALELAGIDDCYVLSAGTDGIDGNTEDAGAMVDGGSVQRAADGDVNAQDALRKCDSNRFLAASGDLLHTGPTGTNVMDIVIGLKLEPENVRRPV